MSDGKEGMSMRNDPGRCVTDSHCGYDWSSGDDDQTADVGHGHRRCVAGVLVSSTHRSTSDDRTIIVGRSD